MFRINVDMQLNIANVLFLQSLPDGHHDRKHRAQIPENDENKGNGSLELKPNGVHLVTDRHINTSNSRSNGGIQTDSADRR